MRKLFIYLLALISTATFSCKQSSNSDSNLSDSIKIKDSITASIKNLELKKVQEEKAKDSIIAAKEKIMNSWLGKYEFSESAKSINGLTSMVWGYDLRVKKGNDNNLIGYINIDGFQTLSRFICTVDYSEQNLDLFLKSYGKDNSTKNYKVGDHLLTLEKADNKIKTHWIKLKPQLDENANKSNAFKKSK